MRSVASLLLQSRGLGFREVPGLPQASCWPGVKSGRVALGPPQNPTVLKVKCGVAASEGHKL